MGKETRIRIDLYPGKKENVMGNQDKDESILRRKKRR